jgi:hypothetical protein
MQWGLPCDLLSSIIATGCASQAQPSASLHYLRTDGRPADALEMQATLAQCKGEGARAVSDYVTGEGAVPWVAGMVRRSSKETTLISAGSSRGIMMGGGRKATSLDCAYRSLNT